MSMNVRDQDSLGHMGRNKYLIQDEQHPHRDKYSIDTTNIDMSHVGGIS